MGFSKQEYGSGLPFSTPKDLPDPGIKTMPLVSPALAGRFFYRECRKCMYLLMGLFNKSCSKLLSHVIDRIILKLSLHICSSMGSFISSSFPSQGREEQSKHKLHNLNKLFLKCAMMTCVSISKAMWLNFYIPFYWNRSLEFTPTFMYSEHCYSKYVPWNPSSENVTWTKAPMVIWILQIRS